MTIVFCALLVAVAVGLAQLDHLQQIQQERHLEKSFSLSPFFHWIPSWMALCKDVCSAPERRLNGTRRLSL